MIRERDARAMRVDGFQVDQRSASLPFWIHDTVTKRKGEMKNTSAPIDHHPERRTAQIESARAILHACDDTLRLRRACTVLLALSSDPMDRMLAERILKEG